MKKDEQDNNHNVHLSFFVSTSSATKSLYFQEQKGKWNAFCTAT